MSTERAKNGQNQHDLFMILTFFHNEPNQLKRCAQPHRKSYDKAGKSINKVQKVLSHSETMVKI